jgi:hypothetical protein
VGRVKRVAQLALGAVGALLYVWFEAVRLAPVVKRRKRLRRR